jgi:ribonuclease D
MQQPIGQQPQGKVHPAKHFRQKHRQQSHEDAHADSPAASHDVPTLAGVPGGKAQLIESDADLVPLLDHIRATGAFAFDTEFIGELSYKPQLCLIQIGTAERMGLIDPLTGVDLSPLWELLCDPAIRKFVHAGEQDLTHVWRATGRCPQNIIDTQVAAGFIGLSFPASLTKLVQEFTGIRLQKGFTFTDWSVRPLSGSQLRYAADDVRYLPLLVQKIEERLALVGRSDWARAECEMRSEHSKPNDNPTTAWVRVRGSNSLDARGLRILQALAEWREAAAQASDVPARTYVKDEVLIDLSRQPPKTRERLLSVKHMPRPVVEYHGERLLALVAKAIAAKDGPQPAEQGPEPLLSDKFRHDCLWAAAQMICCGQQIDSALVTSRQDIVDFDRLLQTGGDLMTHPIMQGWRKLALGDRLVDLTRGTTLTANWEHKTLKI